MYNMINPKKSYKKTKQECLNTDLNHINKRISNGEECCINVKKF